MLYTLKPISLPLGTRKPAMSIRNLVLSATLVAGLASLAACGGGGGGGNPLPQNQAPVARFTATPQTGAPGAAVALNAATSSDAEGAIARFEWDLDGNGSFEFDGGAAATASTTLPNPAGTVTVRLRVTDGAGATATTSANLTSTAPGGGGTGWVIQTLDNTDFVSLIEPDTKTSLAIVGGNPAIAYFQFSTGSLRYIRAADSLGTVWNAPITVGTPGEAGASPSLAVLANGQPAIGFTGPVNSVDDAELRYVRALSNFGTNASDWDIPLEFDEDASAVQLAVLADGHPAICYNETVLTNSLFFRRADDLAGDFWGPQVSVDGNIGAGDWSALRVVDGNPAIAYYEDNGTLQFPQQGVLKYARADTPDGSSWSFQTLDDTGGDAFVSMAVIGGRPAISYYDFADGELRYIRADDAQGVQWPLNFELVDGAGALDVGWFSSLTTIGGIPSIAYGNQVTGDVNFVQSDDASGDAWGAPELVEAGPLGVFMSLQEVDGHPAISYIDQPDLNTASGVLKYAIFLP
jgi:PKD repeat protein